MAIKRSYTAGHDHHRHYKGQKTSHGGPQGGLAGAQSQLMRQVNVIHAKLETLMTVSKTATIESILDSADILRGITQRIDGLPILNPVGPMNGAPPPAAQQPLLPDHKKYHNGPAEFYPNQQEMIPYGGPQQGYGDYYGQYEGYPDPHGQGYDMNYLQYAPAGAPQIPPKGIRGAVPFRGGGGGGGGPRARGVVKSWFIHNNNGFIICRDPSCQGQDVYIMAKHLRPPMTRLRPGDEVEFSLAWMKGRPQARDLCLLNKKHTIRVRGTCHKWNESRKYGFIKAAEYKDNIFCLATEILGRPNMRRLYEGEEVECLVCVDQKGRPQAQDVRPLKNTQQTGAEAE
uniref:CSD domain-containing protein n=1 Tax=Lotharella oceanica TaxID=641309 RepID=A0A7S2X635_9EUKA